MTANQIAYQSLKETQRANLAKELENNRSNVAREQETHRSNVANESENVRSHLAHEQETQRHNVQSEANDRYRTNAQAVTSIFGTAMNVGGKLATAGMLF